ncbi:MAG: NAD(P)/FAD-dependent oxidoreductase [Ktedonobacterales bacterium]|nr:NAD(P)/FAD-dependent oxidoreductase [Ktedonobacterales bacterium]
MFDVIIVGGGAAGLSAALVLGRARREVLLCGEGAPRNVPSPHAHSFFSRDGMAPLALLQIGREQLAPYRSVTYRPQAVVAAVRDAAGFTVVLGDGTREAARRLLLATGVVDELPAIPGLAERWGISVLHCPYCHGWEVRDQPLAVLGNDALAVEQALLISQWSRDLVLCTNGPATFTEDDQHRLRRRGITIHEGHITQVDGVNGTLAHIQFTDGAPLARQALFIRAVQHQRSPLAAQLGCQLTSPFPGTELITVDGTGATTIPGVFAAGDATTMLQQVVAAAASGALAAAMLNRDVLLDDLA